MVVLYITKSNVLILNLTDKIDSRTGEKSIALSNLSIYYIWKNIKKNHTASSPTWNDEFELPDGSYSISDNQDYFEYILKKHGEKIDNLPIGIYVYKVKNVITFKIKTGYYLEILTPETMKLLGHTENKITKDKNGENVLHLESIEVVLVHCNVVNYDY